MELANDYLISISNEKVENKNNNNIWKTLTYDTKKVNTQTLVRLLSEHHAFCSGVFKKTTNLTQSEKTKDNWLQSNVIVIDLDDRKLTYNQFKEVINNSDIIPNIIYPTANNGILGNRYRAVYVFDAPIVNLELYHLIYDSLIKEIERLTEENNKDNCGRNGVQNIAPFYCNIDEVEVNEISYSLHDYLKENKLFSIPNIKSATYKDNKDFSSKRVIKKEESANSTDNVSLSFLYNIILTDCTFQIDNEYFIKDFDKYRRKRPLIQKYLGVYEIIEHTPFEEVGEDEIIIPYPKDYREIERKSRLLRDELGNPIPTLFKIRNGEHRRKKLFDAGIIRKLIKPNISFDCLLFNLIYDFYFYYLNNGNKITMKEIAEIAIRVYQTDITKYKDAFKPKKQKNYKINKAYLAKYNISMNEARGIARREWLKRQGKETLSDVIGEFYDCLLTDKENLKVINESGFKCSLRTLKNWKEKQGLTKKRNTNVIKENIIDIDEKNFRN